jgi:hypothetical protein
MAVRKIGINTRSMTGRHGFSGQQYESALERDLLDLLAFDLNVDRAETQPVTIEYLGDDGRLHLYTPDVLILYRRDILPARDMPHILVEVKYRDEYRGRYHELKQRFRAARRYARERGWVFRVLTEREIRTPYLDNARFLRPYRDLPEAPELEEALLRRLQGLGETCPADLLESLADDDLSRSRYLPNLWKLIANLNVGADLMQPLNMRSLIWHCG